MNRKMIALLTVIMLFLTACGNDNGEVKPSPEPAPDVSSAPEAAPTPIPTPTMTPEPTPTPYDGPINALTGLPIDAKWENARPIAVMLNNLKDALPQHGVAQADVIYEVLAEGGITRMLALYQSVEGVGLIGSVRSARTYYLELALGHDAIYLHAGGSPDAYNKIKSWNVTAFDCVNGPYEGSLFWRDPNRIKKNGYVHSVVTSGDTILKLFPKYNLREEHKEDYSYAMWFAQNAVPEDGEQALRIEVPYSYYKTGVFTYDESSGKYLVDEFGKAYVDGNNGQQVSVTNVFVLETECNKIPGDDAGRLTVDLTEGDGWYACGGKIIPIKWSKDGVNSQIVYSTIEGKPLTVQAGTSYVNIIPVENGITIN